MDIEHIMQHGAYLLTGLGVLAFLVSVITQVIKELPGLVKIQTNLLALIVSMILTPVSVIALCQYNKVPIVWYYVVAAFVSAFIVYLVATGGWERVKAIWDRSKYDKKSEE